MAPNISIDHQVRSKRIFYCKIVEVDERFTSKIASQAISQSGLKKNKREDKKLIDQVSAVLILQSYMDSKTF